MKLEKRFNESKMKNSKRYAAIPSEPASRGYAIGGVRRPGQSDASPGAPRTDHIHQPHFRDQHVSGAERRRNAAKTDRPAVPMQCHQPAPADRGATLRPGRLADGSPLAQDAAAILDAPPDHGNRSSPLVGDGHLLRRRHRCPPTKLHQQVTPTPNATLFNAIRHRLHRSAM